MPTIECTFEGLKQIAKEFREAAPSMNLDELENAWKCFGLAYLGMNEPMWETSARILFRMESKTYLNREMELMTAPVREVPLLTEDEIKAAVADAVKQGSLSWLGFEKDANGCYTIPAMSDSHYQLSRAIEALVLQKAGLFTQLNWSES